MYVVETKNVAQSLAALGSSWYLMLLESALADEELDTITMTELNKRAVNTHLLTSSVVNDQAVFNFTKRLTPHKGVGTDLYFPVLGDEPIYRVGLTDVTASTTLTEQTKVALLTGGRSSPLFGYGPSVEFTLAKPVPVDYVQYEGSDRVMLSAYSDSCHDIGGGQLCTKVRVSVGPYDTLTINALRVFTKNAAYVDNVEATITKAVIFPVTAVEPVLGMTQPLIELDTTDWKTAGEVVLNGLTVTPGKYVSPMRLSFNLNASEEV